LGRLLGESDFGVYGVIISFVFIFIRFLMTGMEQTVSKFVSETPKKHESVKKTAFMLQLSASSIIFLAILLLAPLIAFLLNDLSLIPLIQLVAPLVIVHPLFALFSGALNGLKRFSAQAAFTAFYSFAKVLFIVGLVLLGFGLFGAVSGFILSSAVAVVVGLVLVGVNFKSEYFPARKVAAFALPIGGLAVIINTLMSVDLFAVKALSPALEANLLSGYYTAAGSIAKVIPTLALSLSSVVFPLVSATTFTKNLEKARFYISNGLRYSLLFIVLLSSLFLSLAPETLALVYGERYIPGSFPLQLLALGMGLFAIFMMLTTIISAAGKAKTVFTIGFMVLALDIALNFLLVPGLGMEGAALSTLFSGLFGTMVAAAFVRARFRALVQKRTALRIAVAGLLVFALAPFLPGNGTMVVFKYFLLTVLYIAALAAMRELRYFDFVVFHNIVRK